MISTADWKYWSGQTKKDKMGKWGGGAGGLYIGGEGARGV